MSAVKKAFLTSFMLVSLLAVLIGYGLWNRYGDNPYADQARTFGVTFSTKYAKSLGLNWQETYLAIVEDLQVKTIRIPVYWDEVETEPGRYALDDVQWMMDQAQQHDVDVILAIGRRVPRWPECHPPAWMSDWSEEDIRRSELAMINVMVERFKDHSALTRWQVQNEPFLAFFGDCPKPDKDFVITTIQAVQVMDIHHPIMVTDSGELSSWYQTANIADELGVSMYRTTWNKWFGYFYYPLPPSFYTIKAKYIRTYVDDIIVSELQAEPWVANSILETPLEEQYKSMNVTRFNDNIDFVSRTDFSEILLWGAEWWYWLKTQQNDSAMWDAAREVIRYTSMKGGDSNE